MQQNWSYCYCKIKSSVRLVFLLICFLPFTRLDINPHLVLSFFHLLTLYHERLGKASFLHSFRDHESLDAKVQLSLLFKAWSFLLLYHIPITCLHLLLLILVVLQLFFLLLPLLQWHRIKISFLKVFFSRPVLLANIHDLHQLNFVFLCIVISGLLMSGLLGQ